MVPLGGTVNFKTGLVHAQLVVTTEGVGLVWKSDPSLVELTVAVFIAVNQKAIVSGGNSRRISVLPGVGGNSGFRIGASLSQLS